ncbi:MAG TPA: hypothetical protein VLB29_06645 [Nocardioidaceae bacterium]|nr:hypothetical protein [Nocardioidaceae bacterium]
MARRIYLHVGSPKTGTTFLQEVLWSQKELARQQGLLLPLEAFFDHYLATLAVREIEPQPQDVERASRVWERVVEESLAWDGDVLISHELFAPATAVQAERAIAAFGPEAEVHLVLSVRDLVRQIPAEWQEHVKHRSSAEFDAFVADLRREDPGTWFWQVQDFVDVLKRWGSTLSPERIHVVTVPPAGQPTSLLWDRFAGLLGLDPSTFATTGLRANTSLGYEQAELLRRVNVALGDRLPLPGPYAPDVKSMFAERVLSQQPGTRLALTGDGLEYAVRRSEQLARDLGQLGVDVVGDLTELVPDRDRLAQQPPLATPGDEVVLTESITALTGLLEQYSELRRRATRERQELHRLQQLEREMRERPGKHLLRGLSERWAWAGKARGLARRGRDRLRGRGPR